MKIPWCCLLLSSVWTANCEEDNNHEAELVEALVQEDHVETTSEIKILGDNVESLATTTKAASINTTTASTSSIEISVSNTTSQTIAVETVSVESAKGNLSSTILLPSTTVEEEEEDEEEDEEPEEFEEEEEDDEDSNRMLSFEEWRKQNLEKSGQNDYTDRQPVQREAGFPSRSQSSMSDLDNMIGDEMEIDANIFSPDEGGEGAPEAVAGDNKGNKDSIKTPNAGNTKDSGKFYKDRFNYASFDCAATIIKTNKEAKGAHNILIENKDSYMLNLCSAANKFVIIELCQDILVDTVVIGTFEFFSSMFRNIRISVSDRFPVPEQEWKVLGEFEARSIRDLQNFGIKNPLIWARYVRIEFLSHWGQEFYCPVSLVRVHGTTMMEEYKSHGVQGSPKESGKMESAQSQSTFNHTQDENEVNVDKQQGSDTSDTAAPAQEQNQTTPEANSLYQAENKVNQAILKGENETTTNQVQINDNLNGEPMASGGYAMDSTLCVPGMGNFSDIFFDSKPDFCQPITSSSVKTKPSVPASSVRPNTNTNNRAPQSNEPTTQESIYQTIMKRIALLESNATLSMQYIESQTQTLLERVLRVDKKYELKIENFLTKINNSVIAQFRGLDEQRRRISEMVQSAVISQEAHNKFEMARLDERLQELADDLRYQKKVGIVQALILLIILLFVITTRGASVDSSFFITSSSGGGGESASSSSSSISSMSKFRKQHRRQQKSATSDDGDWPPFSSATALSSPLYFSRASSPRLYHARSLPALRRGGSDEEEEEERNNGKPTPNSSETAGTYEYDEIYYEPSQQLSNNNNTNTSTEQESATFQIPTPGISRETSPA